VVLALLAKEIPAGSVWAWQPLLEITGNGNMGHTGPGMVSTSVLNFCHGLPPVEVPRFSGGTPHLPRGQIIPRPLAQEIKSFLIHCMILGKLLSFSTCKSPPVNAK